MELSPKSNKYHGLFEVRENSINVTNARIVNKYISNVYIFMLLFCCVSYYICDQTKFPKQMFSELYQKETEPDSSRTVIKLLNFVIKVVACIFGVNVLPEKCVIPKDNYWNFKYAVIN